MSAVLDGVRVVSLATNLPGPIAAARLTELGASVTKIEPPAGDPLALASPLWYDELTSGQRILALDLKEPEDRLRLDGELGWRRPADNRDAPFRAGPPRPGERGRLVRRTLARGDRRAMTRTGKKWWATT